MTWQQTILDRVRSRALELQAEGPDEFPYGYYEYLAGVELGVIEEHEG